MKVAVVGASGFVGRHVLTELAARPGVAVVATASPRNFERRPAIGAASWVPLDIKSPPAECLGELGHPDVVIHLAWGGLPNYRSLHHFEVELPAQYSFLSGLVRAGLGSLLVLGTCFEYGFQSGPLAANAETRPANPYALAKDALRKQLQELKNERAFRLTWARLFYVYGEGQPETSLFAQLRRAVAAGKPAFDMSGGEQLRDYLPIADAARRIVDLALDPGAEIVNVCSGAPISVRALVERWIAENGWRIDLNLGRYPYPDYEPMAFWGELDP